MKTVRDRDDKAGAGSVLLGSTVSAPDVKASFALAQGLEGLVVPDGLERAHWLGLSTAPGFEYWWDWFALGAPEMDKMIQAFKAMAGLGYYPPLLAEHIFGEDTQTRRLGKALDLRRWRGIMPGESASKEWLVSLVQWTPKAWQEIQDGEIEYISPHYASQTDSQGNWWPLTLLEVSAASIPLQKHIRSVKEWASSSGVAMSGSNRMPRMTQEEWARLLKANPEFGALKAGIDQNMANMAARIEAGVKAGDDEVMGQLMQDMQGMQARLNEMLGMVAQNRARLDSMEGQMAALSKGGEDMPEPEDDNMQPGEDDPTGEEVDASAGEGAQGECKDGEEEDMAKASVSSKEKELRAQLAAERKARKVAEIKASLASGGGQLVIEEADAAWMSQLPQEWQTKLLERLGAKASAPPVPPAPPAPDAGVFAGRKTQAGTTPPAPVQGDDGIPLSDKLFAEAEAEVAKAKAEGKRLGLDAVYFEKLKAAGLV